MPSPEASKENLKKIKKRTGRPKGSKDKFTSLKDSFLQAFEGIGGTEAMIDWAQEKKNRKDFYQMIAKMLPNKVEGDLSGKMTVIFKSAIPEPDKPPEKG